MKYLAFFCCLAVFGQQQAKPPEKGSVQGQVVNSATGEPVKKVAISLRSNDRRQGISYSAVTDAGGRFSISDVASGDYRLTGERAGFVRGEYTTPGNRGGLTLTPGQKIESAVIKLTPQAVVTGHIVDEDGDPLSGASVNVWRYSYVRGKKQLTPAGGVSTDDQGEYRIHSLAPGKYYLSASYRLSGNRFSREADNTPETYALTYYPNAVDLSAAAALNATAGAVLRGMDIRLGKVRTVQISGKVVDPAGAVGGRRTMVSAVSRDTPGGMFAGRRGGILDEQGRFVISGLRPGSYLLSADRFDGQKRYSARLPIGVGNANLEGITLVLAPALEVSGNIKVEGTQDAKVAGISISLLPRGDGNMMGNGGGRVKSDGSFVLSNAGPDVYTVSVSGLPENLYVKSMRFAEDDVLATGLNLGRGGAARLEIVLDASAGTVETVVLDAKQQPAANAMVVAVPEGPRRDWPMFYKSGATDQYGRVTLKGIAPGDYKLYAWDNVENSAWLDADFVKAFDKQAEPLSIKENAHESKQLVVIPASDLPQT